MMKTHLSIILSVVFISIVASTQCDLKSDSGEVIKVCCADYEANGNDCIVCSKGYTSDTGQNCRPCSKNYYGERCRYECICSDFEFCDNVEGCVQLSSTTGTSMYATSDKIEQPISEKVCNAKTESGAIKKVCCADFEGKGNNCIACLEGFTSDMGQNCRPCSNNTFGERCQSECVCSVYERCDHVKGCVSYSTTYTKSVYETSSDRSLTVMTTPATQFGKDITSSYREENTNKQCTGCSNQGLLFREVIVYSALSVLVSGFGICLCFVSLKYKTLTKKYIVTFSQTRNSSIPQQIQTVEIADRLYDIIHEEDLLDDRRIEQIQTEMSSEYLDVIHDSNIRESCESKNPDNQDNPCQLISIDQTLNQVRNFKVDYRSLMSGDSNSSSDEYQWDSTQDYLNPYQPMLDISPPVERKYLTIATAHTREDVIHKGVALVRNEYKLHHPRKHGELAKDAMTKLYDKHTSASVSFGSNVTKDVSIKEGGKESKSYENLNVEWFKIEGE